MASEVNSSRPFYFHSGDSYLLNVFDYVHNHTGVMPAVLPEKAPEDEHEAEIWYEALSEGHSQGCGHIRLQLDPLNYAAYGFVGLYEPMVNVWLIKSFFKYFWTTETNSTQRAKTEFRVLTGTLKGKALSIIHHHGPEECNHQSIALQPMHGGSTQFLYQPEAVTEFRESVLAPFFAKKVDKKIQASDVLANIKSLQNVQLNATLYLLSPVNKVPVYNVNITTRADEIESGTHAESPAAHGK
jgi:hypothetical protein